MSSPDFEDGGDLLDLDEALSIRQRWRQERQNRPRPDTLDALKGDRDRTRRQIAGRARSPYHERPIIRVDHPKLPPLGEFFREHARRIDGHDPSLLTLSYLVREALYSPGNFVLPIEWGPKKAKLFRFIPGHTWDHETIGPTPSDVFVLGKMPGRDEVAFRRSFIGPSGEYLAELLQKILPTEYPLGKWYVTNILKHGHPDPGSDKNVPPAMIANCRHLLFQELAIVKPKYILCVGADAAKALFGNSATINRMEGQVLDYALPNGAKAQAMVTVHPAQVLREPHRETQIETTLYRYSRLVQGLSVFEDESERDYRTIQTQADLLDWITEVRQELAEADDPILAVDAEWHGEHPQNKGAYLRTLQVAWGVGKAACIVLRHQGGKYAFDISQKRLFAILKKKLFGRKTRICGHFLNSDLEMLTYYGLDLRENFVAPGKAKGKLPAWQRTRREGGFDTAIAMHNIEETARLKLELVALRYTNMRRWDGDLRKWVEDFCREHDLKSDDLEGFGRVSRGRS
jgi:uracil-DNA glycosylase family 4